MSTGENPNPMSLQQRWEAARGIIEHEDTLTVQRMTWLMTLQGFLFTGLALSPLTGSSVDCANGGRRFSLGASPGAQVVAQSYFGK